MPVRFFFNSGGLVVSVLASCQRRFKHCVSRILYWAFIFLSHFASNLFQSILEVSVKFWQWTEHKHIENYKSAPLFVWAEHHHRLWIFEANTQTKALLEKKVAGGRRCKIQLQLTIRVLLRVLKSNPIQVQAYAGTMWHAR